MTAARDLERLVAERGEFKRQAFIRAIEAAVWISAILAGAFLGNGWVSWLCVFFGSINLADALTKRHRAIQDLGKVEGRLEMARLNVIRDGVRADSLYVQLPHVVLAKEGYGPFEDPYRQYDLFVSHASEDKSFVRPIVEALRARNVCVWYDESEIRLGDSLREKIDAGLARCRFGVVTLSHAFFSKPWTAYELNGLVSREIQGRKVILPIWHPELSIADVIAYSPTLADKKALLTNGMSAVEIADELTALIREE